MRPSVAIAGQLVLFRVIFFILILGKCEFTHTTDEGFRFSLEAGLVQHMREQFT